MFGIILLRNQVSKTLIFIVLETKVYILKYYLLLDHGDKQWLLDLLNAPRNYHALWFKHPRNFSESILNIYTKFQDKSQKKYDKTFGTKIRVGFKKIGG